MNIFKIICIFGLVLFLCSCNNDNSAFHEYKGDTSNETLITGDISLKTYRVKNDFGFCNLTSCYSNSDYVYTFFTENNYRNNLFLVQKNGECEKINIEYTKINACVQLNENIVLHCYNEGGEPCIVETDIHGKSINVVQTNYCEAMFSNGENIYLISLNSDDEYEVTEYDSKLNVLRNYNLSQKLCIGNELLINVKFFDGDFYILKAVGVKNRDEEEIKAFKMVIYSADLLDVKETIDLTDLINTDDFADFYVSDDEVEIVFNIGDNYGIQRLNLGTGKKIEDSCFFSADRIFESGYCFDGVLYDYDNNIVRSGVNNSSIIDYKPFLSGESIITYERISDIHIYNIFPDTATINERIVPVTSELYNEGSIAIHNDNVAIVASSGDDENDYVFIIDRADRIYKRGVSGTSVSDLEITDKEIIYISDGNLYAISLIADDDPDLPIKFSVKGKPVTIGRNSNDDIILAAVYESKVLFLKYEKGKFIAFDELNIEDFADNVVIINGNNKADADFYLWTTEKIYKYREGELIPVIDVSVLNSICDISDVAVINDDYYIIVGKNYKTLASEVYAVSKAYEEKNILNIAAIPELKADIYEMISDYNSSQTENQAIAFTMNDNMLVKPDILVYTPETDVSIYFPYQQLADLSELQNNDDFLPVFSNKYQMFSSFYIRMRYNYNADQKIKPDLSEQINDFMIFDLEKLYEPITGNYNFINEDFYKTLKRTKSNDQLEICKNYRSILEALSNIKFQCSKDCIIVPDVCFSVMNDSNKNSVLDFVDYIMKTSYYSDYLDDKDDKLYVYKEHYYTYALKKQISRSEIDRMLKTISNAKKYPLQDSYIKSILNDSFQEYVESDVSEEIISKTINNRINLYLNERK